MEGATLTATSLATGSGTWSFSGDGTLDSAPLVAGSTVLIGSADGNDGAIPAPDEQNVSQPLTGLATSGGLIVVPAGSVLAAYR